MMVSDSRWSHALIVILALWILGFSSFSWYRSATVGNEIVERAILAAERSIEVRDLVLENNRMSLFFKHDVAALCRATGAACSTDTMRAPVPDEGWPP